MECDGSGYCLTVQMICEFNCKLQNCPNYIICSNTAPQFMLNFNKGVCNDCITKLGKCIENPTTSNPILSITDSIDDCPVCLQFKSKSVNNPRCSHKICIDCIKAIYWYEDHLFRDLIPVFPHTELEQTFIYEPELFINDKLVSEWKKQLGSWNEHRIEFVVNNKKYLKHCPICRK